MDHEEVLRQRHAAHEEAMRGANEVAQTRLRAELESSEAKAFPAVTNAKEVHGPAATMNLWHKRLGCSKAKIGFMNKQAIGEGMNI